MKKHSIQQPIFIPNQPSNFQKILKKFLNLLKAHKLGNYYRAALLAAKGNKVNLQLYRTIINEII